MSNVTEKNTKREILRAYADSLTSIQALNAQKASLRDEVNRAAEDKLLTSVNELGGTDVVSSLHDLGKKIEDAYGTFQGVQDAIEIKQKELKDVHGIMAMADSLAALMDVQRETSLAAQQKNKMDQTSHREVMMGLKDESEKALIKVKDEYAKRTADLEYNFSRKNTVLIDEFSDKNKKCNREIYEKEQHADASFKNREESLLRAEKEYAMLKEKVDCFPDLIIEAEDLARAEGSAKANADHQHAMENAKTELTHLEEKHKVVSDTLKVKLTSVLEEISYLKRQLETQSDKVNDIASKAIEGAARTQNVTNYQRAPVERAGV